MKGFQEKSDRGGIWFVVKHNTICQESKREREGFEPIEVRDPRNDQMMIKFIKRYECLEAMVTRIEWRDVEYNDRRYMSWRIHLDADGTPGVLELPFDSRVSGRFMRLAENIDFTKPVEFSAWKSKDDTTAFAVKQDGQNVSQKYTKDNPGECPEPTQKFGGKWDFDGVNAFLHERMINVVIPRVEALAASNGHPAAAPASPAASLDRETLVKDVMAICKDLNDAGDEKKWTSGSLRTFVNEIYEVEDGLESLTPDYLNKLKTLLSERLSSLEDVPF